MVDQTVMNTRARVAMVHARKRTNEGQAVVRAGEQEDGLDVPTRIPTGPDGGITLGVARGRTIARDNFESLRVDLEVTTRVDQEAADEAYFVLAEWADEWIKREEASAYGHERADGAVADIPGTGRRIELSYGMTISGAQRYEMHRLDVTMGVPVPDGDPVEETAQALAATLEARLAAQDRAVRAEFPPRKG